MKTCKYCKIKFTPYYAKGNQFVCRDLLCRKEYSKEYRLNNKAKSKEYSAKFYLKNKERISEYKKKYYLKNKEKIKKQYLDNIDKRKSYLLKKKKDLKKSLKRNEIL